MPKLDRYLFREFTQSFLATLIILLMVSVGGVMADLLGDVADGKVPARLLPSRVGLHFLNYMPYLRPLALGPIGQGTVVTDDDSALPSDTAFMAARRGGAIVDGPDGRRGVAVVLWDRSAPREALVVAADGTRSNLVHSGGSTGTPSLWVGRVPAGRSSRRPVSVVASSIS